MSPRSRPLFRLSRWLVAVAASAATAGQLSLVLLPLAEAREGRSAAAHVEQGGVAAHYAHNDATCAACQARTLHGAAPAAPALWQDITTADAIQAATVERTASTRLRAHHPRAPPVQL